MRRRNIINSTNGITTIIDKHGNVKRIGHINRCAIIRNKYASLPIMKYVDVNRFDVSTLQWMYFKLCANAIKREENAGIIELNQSDINLHIKPASCVSINNNDEMTSKHSHIGKDLDDTRDFTESLTRLNVRLQKVYNKHEVCKIEDVAKYDIHKTITIHFLRKLESYGEVIAGNIARGKNDVNATIEDLANEVFIYLFELSKIEVIFVNGKIEMTQEQWRGLRNVIRRYLNMQAQRHYKNLYIDVANGQYATIDDASTLASMVDDITPILQRYDIFRFLRVLNTKNHNIGEVFALTLQGYKEKEIAEKLNLHVNTVKNYKHEYRKQWQRMFGNGNGAKGYSYISNCEY